MLRSLHHFLEVGASPLLHQWKPRRIPTPFPAVAHAPEARGVSQLQLLIPELCSRPGVGFRAFRMSAARPESSTDGEGATSPDVAGPSVSPGSCFISVLAFWSAIAGPGLFLAVDCSILPFVCLAESRVGVCLCWRTRLLIHLQCGS